MNEMYTSVFPVTRDQKNAGIQVVAIVLCDQDAIETLKEMHGWRDTHFAYATREDCVTVLVVTTNTDTVDMLNQLCLDGREDKFAFLTVQVGFVADRFKVKLGSTEYFVTQGSEVLQEVPEENKPEPILQPTPANDYLPNYARPRHHAGSRGITL